SVAALAVIVLFAAGGVLVAWGGFGYAVTTMPPADGPSNPLWATTVPQSGAWLDNFVAHPWMMIAPALGFLGAALAFVGLRTRHELASLGGSSMASAGIIATVGLSMFPVILPSSVDPHSSLLVWNASSSQHTLGIMLVCTVIFLPVVLAYTAWVYRVMWGRVTTAEISTNPDLY
ncbi:cytochrome d ubiquinol oxidase subunit II, partial [Endobacter medicaginis]